MYQQNALRKTTVFLLVIALIFTMGFSGGQSFADSSKAAANGTGFIKINDSVKIVFTGDEADSGQGFNGRYLTLMNSSFAAITSHPTASDDVVNAALGTSESGIYVDNVTYSGMRKDIYHYHRISGLNLEKVADSLNIINTDSYNIETKATDGYTFTVLKAFADKYAFLTKSAVDSDYEVAPAVALSAEYIGDSSSAAADMPRVYIGQDLSSKADDPNMQSWARNVNLINVGSWATAFTLNNNGTNRNVYLGDIIKSKSGQYNAEFNYTNSSNEVKANLTGIPLTNLLADMDIDINTANVVIHMGSIQFPVTEENKNKMFVAYNGTESVNGGIETAIQNETDIQIYGPGSTKAQVCLSDVTGITVTTKAPDAPTGVTAKAKSYNSINLSWTKVPDARGYYIYRYDNKTKKYTEILDTDNGSTTSFTDTKLATGTKYTYKIKSYIVVGNKEVLSNDSKTAAVTPKLSKTSQKKLKKSGKKAVLVKWKKVAGANGYQIYKATKKNGKYKKTATVKKGNKISYKDKKVKKGKKYYYKVRAYRTVNGKKVYGSFSAVRSIKR